MSRFVLLIVAFLAGQSYANFDYAKCNSGKGECFGVPIACLITKSCSIAVWYGKEGDQYRFDVTADYKGEDVTDKWVGVGLSLDGGRGMGNDAVVACFVDQDGAPHVNNYWNRVQPFFSVPVEDAEAGLSDVSLTSGDSKLECSFLRDASTSILTPTDDPETVTVDLNSTPYHVMLATGPLDEAGQVSKHSKQGLTIFAIDFPSLS